MGTEETDNVAGGSQSVALGHGDENAARQHPMAAKCHAMFWDGKMGYRLRHGIRALRASRRDEACNGVIGEYARAGEC